MQITANIEGFDQAVKALDKLPDKFQRQAILAILRRSTRPMIRAARSRLLSHGNSYSQLSKAIGNITPKSKNPIIYVGPRIKGKWKYVGYIAHWVEYGTKGIKKSSGGTARSENDMEFGSWVSRIPLGGKYREDQPPRPFMRPAIDGEKNNVASEVRKNLAEHLDKSVNRLFKKI